MVTQIDFDSFPVVRKGQQFQDFTPGEKHAHHWGRTLTDGDNALFSTATCNWNPMHLNVEYARAHGHDDVVVNPMLVLCTVVGLSVEDLSEVGGPFLGMEDVTFHEPVPSSANIFLTGFMPAPAFRMACLLKSASECTRA